MNFKYLELVEKIKDQILSKNISIGEKLPSENELSARYGVSRETVRKALAILEEEGFIEARHGSGTFCREIVRHSGTSRNVALVTTYLTDYIFPRVIQGVEKVAAGEGYSIILKSTNNSRTREAKCLEELLSKDIEGIILEPSKSHIYCKYLDYFRKLKDYNIPCVFIQGMYSQLSDMPSVLLDDELGGYLITKYLISLGHKNIAGVFKSDDIQGQNRHKGYVRALREAGMEYNPDHVIWFYTEDRVIHPAQSIKNLVTGDSTVDGIVCYNDQTAIKIIRSLSEIGKRVPEDISVTGFDNSDLAGSGLLRITTVLHPQEELGEAAGNLLLNLIKYGDSFKGERHIVMKPEVIPGDTCRAR
ncbi:MAG: GntR family transcriptional regulator [Lachnospiraceae bacterium]|nr:GntR family transcriptional regulator [Lachnospiraceae bacterium]